MVKTSLLRKFVFLKYLIWFLYQIEISVKRTFEIWAFHLSHRKVVSEQFTNIKLCPCWLTEMKASFTFVHLLFIYILGWFCLLFLSFIILPHWSNCFYFQKDKTVLHSFIIFFLLCVYPTRMKNSGYVLTLLTVA